MATRNQIRNIIYISFAICSLSLSQDMKYVFSGVVTDSNGIVLPYATVRVVGTTIGTICDGNGKYEILLTRGFHEVLFSFVGHRPKRIFIDLQNELTKNITLPATDILLAEVLVQGENPAYPIIRRAIERKIKTIRQIHTYGAKTYTKDTFGRDTSLSLISEAYSDIYYQANDSLREIIVHRRQSSNLSPELQLAVVRDFINFYNDTIRHWGFTFITPLADSAFEYYDYLLEKSYSNDGILLFDIQVIPKSKTLPLFSGIITISDSNYYLHRVIVEPNDIFHVPMISIKKFQFSQQFSMYNDRYWMPIEYHITAEVRFRFFNLILDTNASYYKKSVICYEYQINKPIDDSIRQLQSLTLLQNSIHDDTTHWNDVVVFPLTQTEKQSYKQIDEIVKSQPMIFNVLYNIRDYEKALTMIDLRYNRVEGLFLGGNLDYKIATGLRSHLNAGIGIADQKFKYRISTEIGIDPDNTWWIGAEWFDWIGTSPANYSVVESFNSFAALLDADDYYNYHSRHGSKFFLAYDHSPDVSLTAGVSVERQKSLLKRTDISFESIGSFTPMRVNPAIDEGRSVSLFVDWHTIKRPQTEMFERPKTMWRVKIERSVKQSGGEFDFISAYSSLSFRLPTMGNFRLFDPYLGIAFSAGRSWGKVPIQRIFAFESPLSRYAFPGTFRTVLNTEFTGDRFYAASVEHNFRNIPFILAGLPSVNFDIVIGASVGDIRNGSSRLKNIVHPASSLYKEYSIGLGRVFDIFRIDFSYSDYLTGRYAVTFSSYL